MTNKEDFKHKNWRYKATTKKYKWHVIQRNTENSTSVLLLLDGCQYATARNKSLLDVVSLKIKGVHWNGRTGKW